MVKHATRKQSSSMMGSDGEKSWRIRFLVFFIFFISLSVVAKLFFLQIQSGERYAAIAKGQHMSVSEIKARRGEIFLDDSRNDPYPLAVNKEIPMAIAVSSEMNEVEREKIGTELCEILGLEKDFVKNKLSDPNDKYEILKHKLSTEEAQQLRDAKLPGVYLESEVFRQYPAGELASQIIGFVGSDGMEQKGMYGLESYWENELKGANGKINQEGDSRGRWISVSDRNIQEAKDGVDLHLTINHTVQFEVEKILKETTQQFSADSGTIIVMDPKTGKILALANSPSFDPNNFAKTEDISFFANPAISEPYESGSVFKAITEAIGIEDGKINPSTTYTDTGIVKEAGYEIQNSDFKANGIQTMTQVLEKSLNTGVIYIEKLVGNAKFADYVKNFGFGQKTGIDLPGELSGNVRNLNNPKTAINFYTASFGQGITVTPVQLVAAYGAIANGGVLMRPYVVDKKIYPDGYVEQTQPQETRHAISGETAKQVSDMLRSVVVNGHGKRADVPGYLVGGKTGTAQVAKIGSKGYEEGMNIGSFVGMAPLNDPRFVVLVKIVNPKGVQWAESSAAPTFGSVMKFLLEYYNIKPTEDPSMSPLAHQASSVTETAVAAQPGVENSPQSEDEKKKSQNNAEKNKNGGANIIISGD